jgi:hypothetical protein
MGELASSLVDFLGSPHTGYRNLGEIDAQRMRAKIPGAKFGIPVNTNAPAKQTVNANGSRAAAKRFSAIGIESRPQPAALSQQLRYDCNVH